MFRKLAILVVVITLASGQGEEPCGDVGNADTLQLTITMFRHGDRTPLYTYPNDPYNVTHWDKWGGWGCLTQIGIEQQYRLGRWVRKCYGPILSDTYLPNQIYVRSTDIDRTLMSGLSHIAGLFSPHDFQVWSKTEELAKYWQPIPIHTIYHPDEYLLTPDGFCPPYQKMLEDVWKNDVSLKKIEADNQPLLNYIATNAGLNMPGSLQQISTVMSDTVFVERLKGLQLPLWMNSTVQDALISWRNLGHAVHVFNDDILRLGMGDLVYNMVSLLINKTKDTIKYRHVIYSAHDSTVGCLLHVFDPNLPTILPPYASIVLTELHFDTEVKRYFVKVFFRNDTTTTPYPVTIRNCGEKCWLDDFARILQPFSLSSKKAFCLSSSSTSPAPTLTIAQKSASTVDESDGLTRDELIALCVCATFAGTLILSGIFFLVLFPMFKRPPG